MCPYFQEVQAHPPQPSQLAKNIHSASGLKAGDRNWKTQLPPAESVAHLMTLLLKSVPHQSDASYLFLL